MDPSTSRLAGDGSSTRAGIQPHHGPDPTTPAVLSPTNRAGHVPTTWLFRSRSAGPPRIDPPPRLGASSPCSAWLLAQVTIRGQHRLTVCTGQQETGQRCIQPCWANAHNAEGQTGVMTSPQPKKPSPFVYQPREVIFVLGPTQVSYLWSETGFPPGTHTPSRPLVG